MRAAIASRVSALVVWGSAALAVALVVWGLVGPASTDFDLWIFVVLAAMVALTALGALIVRRAQNPIGWIFQVMAVAGGITFISSTYVEAAYIPHPRALPFVSAAAWLANLAPLLVALPIPLLFLLFPTGRPVSPRWRWAVRLFWVGAALSVAWQAFKPGEVYRTGPPHPYAVGNPLGIPWPGWVSSLLLNLGGFAVFSAALLGLAALIVRYRRSHGEERQQMRWLAFVAIAAATFFISAVLLNVLGIDLNEGVGNVLWMVAVGLLLAGVPAAVAIAVLRYRLYSIDLVINKTLVYGSLAAFITAVYVGVVVGIGTLFGRGDQPNLGLSILATGVVAVAFQPVRERVQGFANRLVYGKRATPYEVLSEFGHRMASTYAAEEVLPRMARILGEGTGAAEATVSLRISGELVPAAGWPEAAENGASALPRRADLLVPVAHQGEELGALSIRKPAGDRLSPAEEKLARDLASQAGLVLRNVKLIEDLKASRVRLVQAQDSERRRIERNIHDGAQQQLVALGVKLGLARRLTGQPGQLEEILTRLQEESNQALADLRDLARGIYPPLLQDQGLKAALEAQARKSPLTVTVEADSLGRYPQEIEAAIYFCVLEALQNASKYARPSQATVGLFSRDGDLGFEVTDDGVGFDVDKAPRGSGLTNMADRMAALGGRIDVESTPGRGTIITGRVPIKIITENLV